MSDTACWNCGMSDRACTRQYTNTDDYCCVVCETLFTTYPEGTPHGTPDHDCTCGRCGRPFEGTK